MSEVFLFEQIEPNTRASLARAAAALLLQYLYGDGQSRPSRREITKHITGQPDGRSHYIIRAGREVLGAASVTHAPDLRETRVHAFATREDMRNRGIGRALMLGIAEAAQRLGCDEVSLHPSAEAFVFYRHLGFEPVVPGNLYELRARVETLFAACASRNDPSTDEGH